ncbi:MAG: Bug family tripartite tricarboxylate transporter substrate binding protein, partial [Rhodospirillaceae bacterium]
MENTKVRSICAVAMLLVAQSLCAAATSYPDRPVRVIVPYAPGGSSDMIARVVGQRLSERLGQQFVVDNRAGGGTLIGTDIAAHAPADGHTLLVATPPLVVNPTLYARVNYVVDRDFSAVCNMAGSSNLLVVHPSLNATTVKELIALARARPDHYTYGSSGI